MPRGIPTSTIPKPVLVETLCQKIGIDFNSEVFNPSNGTITKELLQAVCEHLHLSAYHSLSKTECARQICSNLSLACDSIDFNPMDDTISAGFIEKIINAI